LKLIKRFKKNVNTQNYQITNPKPKKNEIKLLEPGKILKKIFTAKIWILATICKQQSSIYQLNHVKKYEN
jgi:hypothetical protein